LRLPVAVLFRRRLAPAFLWRNNGSQSVRLPCRFSRRKFIAGPLATARGETASQRGRALVENGFYRHINARERSDRRIESFGAWRWVERARFAATNRGTRLRASGCAADSPRLGKAGEVAACRGFPLAQAWFKSVCYGPCYMGLPVQGCHRWECFGTGRGRLVAPRRTGGGGGSALGAGADRAMGLGRKFS
jgi:hypothetical protein